jgi:hypothetical protein
LSLRTYIPEPERKPKRRWTDKPPELKAAVYANRRRTKTDKSKRLQRLRSERVERSFAHVCETGGARRPWLCGIEKIRKRYLFAAAARNLGIVMRAVFGTGMPRGLQPEGREDGLAVLMRLARLAVRACQIAQAMTATLANNLRSRAANPATQTLAT